MAPQAAYISEMSGDFERRSIVLTLQELADKTPAGEPLLITAAERRAYLQFLRTRAIQPEGFASSVEMFAGRELKVINEAIVIPPRLMSASVRYSGEQILAARRGGKSTSMAAPQVDASNTKIRYLLNKLRAVFGQGELSPADVAQINKLVEGGPAAEVSRVELELANRLRELENKAGEIEMDRQVKMAALVARGFDPNSELLGVAADVMFVGEDSRLAGMANQIQDTVYQRKLNAMAAQQEMNQIRAMGEEAAGWQLTSKVPPGNYNGISRADVAGFSSEPGGNVEYRAGSNGGEIADRVDAVIRGGIPGFATASAEAFKNFIMAQLAQEDARAMNGGGQSAPQQKQRAASTTVKNIPVGVSRSYFEE